MTEEPQAVFPDILIAVVIVDDKMRTARGRDGLSRNPVFINGGIKPRVTVAVFADAGDGDHASYGTGVIQTYFFAVRQVVADGLSYGRRIVRPVIFRSNQMS